MTKIRSISSRVSIGLRAKAVFGVIFAVVGLGIIIWLSVLPILRYLDAQDWEETPCTILHSQVSSNRSSDGTTYSIDIRYRYEFKGREYRSSRYSFLKLSSSGYAAKQAVVNRHRARSRARCYVDPDNPSQAVLSTEFSFGYLFGLMGFFFFVPGCLAVFASLRQGKGSSLISRGGLGLDKGSAMSLSAIGQAQMGR